MLQVIPQHLRSMPSALCNEVLVWSCCTFASMVTAQAHLASELGSNTIARPVKRSICERLGIAVRLAV